MPLRHAALPGHDAGTQAVNPVAAVDVSTVDACDSTNGVLMARARAGSIARPTILRTRAQTAGRGRLGRVWHMDPAASLALSIAWPLRRAPDALSLCVGAALADELEPDPGDRPRIGLKWPNDLWLDGPRKLAGILVEAVPGVAVVGIGLNVRPLAVPAGAGPVAVLAELDPAATPDSVFDALWPRLVAALGSFDAHGFAAGFEARFSARDALRGTPVRATVAGGSVDGRADGVDPDGALRLRVRTLDRVGDRVVRVTSGEIVTVRPTPALAPLPSHSPAESAAC